MKQLAAILKPFAFPQKVMVGFETNLLQTLHMEVEMKNRVLTEKHSAKLKNKRLILFPYERVKKC